MSRRTFVTLWLVQLMKIMPTNCIQNKGSFNLQKLVATDFKKGRYAKATLALSHHKVHDVR